MICVENANKLTPYVEESRGFEKECRKSYSEGRAEDKKLVRTQDIHETKADADEIDQGDYRKDDKKMRKTIHAN